MSLLAAWSNLGLEGFVDDPTKKFQNAIFANGIWQRRQEPVGTFTIQTHKIDGKALGLTKDCSFHFESSLPKIPITLLRNIHALYVDMYKKFKSEVYVSIYWDILKKDYFLYVPKQQVSGASVRFENDADMLNNPNHFIVMDSHSHNVMGAFWSAQDIADQKASRLFSVLGKILSDKPEILITAGSNQQEKRLTVEEVFDLSVEKLHPDSDYSIPASQLANVTEYKPAAASYYNTNNSFYKPGAYVPPAKTAATTHKPATSGNNYYNSNRQQLINKLNDYSKSYSLSSIKLQDIFMTFLDFVEEESLSLTTTYSKDLDDMSDCVDNICVQVEQSLQNIMEYHGIATPVDDEGQIENNPSVEVQENITVDSEVEELPHASSVEKDEKDITDFSLQSNNTNLHS